MKYLVTLVILSSIGLHAATPLRHYTTHTLFEPMVEGALKAIGVDAELALSMSPGDASLERLQQALDEIRVKMRASPPKEAANIVAALAPGIALILARVYSAYKLPQWIDSYLLKENTERSSLQNIVSFAGRHGTVTRSPLTLGVKIGYQPLNKDLVLRNLITEIAAQSVR